MIWDHDQEILSEGEDFYAEFPAALTVQIGHHSASYWMATPPMAYPPGTGQRFRLRTLASKRVPKSLSCCPRWRASLDSMTYLSIRI